MPAETVKPESQTKRRNFSRRHVLWPAKLEVGKHVFSCQIWNVSLGGARLRIDVPLKEGSEVVLDIPSRGRIPSVVSWSNEQGLGLSFQVGPDRVREMFHSGVAVLGLDNPPD
ncbi:PilZ domain-containing protein [Gimibacter soli]|uniref:PilZ domain-containing protein n=1 Tax=Gimibacter soli TaxID=3024400 RepID=A0AAF0BKP8_9PROT|nr:PilZ domain-containing protein [Gimibacter soli]WCL54524.1 PilZ domain-containing protein [Gimibacter soli]